MEQDDNRILHYDGEGNPQMDKNPFLTNLWHFLSLKDTNFINSNDKKDKELDYSNILGPISAAHQDVKAILLILDSISNPNTNIGFSKLGTSFKDTNPIINFQKSNYTETAVKLRLHANLLREQQLEDIRMSLVAKKFQQMGWPVEYSLKYGMWLVDYGYKARFCPFWEHLKTVEERSTYAVINRDETLLLPSKLENARLIFNRRITPNIYNHEISEQKKLQHAQQSLIEVDFFEEKLKPALMQFYPKAQISTKKIIINSTNYIELSSDYNEENVEIDSSLLRGIFEYLKNPINFDVKIALPNLFNL